MKPCIATLSPSCVCSIMAWNWDETALSVSSRRLMLTCRERGRKGGGGSGGKRGDRAESPFTQLEESSAQTHSPATCALTFLFCGDMIYSTVELKAELAAPLNFRDDGNSSSLNLSEITKHAVCCSLVARNAGRAVKRAL